MDKKKQSAKRGIVGSGAAISGSKKSEQAKESPEQDRAKYRTLFEAIADAAFCIDQQTGNILDVNSAATRIYGFTHEEFVKLKNTDVSAEIEKTARDTHDIVPLIPVRYHKRKDGSVFPVEITANTCEIEGRTVIICTIRDITEHLKAENEVSRQQAFLRQVIDSNPNLIFVKDSDDRYLLANNVLANAHGTTPAYLQGKTDLELGVPAEEFAMYRQDDIEVLQSGKEKIIPDESFTWQSGEVHYYHTTKRPLADEKGEFNRILAVSVDITERKQADAALKESEERFLYVLENVQDAFWSADLSGQFEFLSPLMAHIYGRPLVEMLANPAFWIEAVHPDDQITARDSGEALNRDGRIELEYRIVLPDGTVRWILDRKTLIRDAHGKSSRIAGIISDVTGRKRVEETLRENEERFAAAFSINPDPTAITVSETGQFVNVNPAYEKWSGFSREELLGKTSRELNLWVNPADRDTFLKRLRKHEAVEDMEITFRVRSGELRDTWFTARTALIGGREHLLTRAHDVTERNRMLEAVRDSEEKYRMVVENAQEAIYIAVDGILKFGNNKAAELSGYSQEDLTSTPFVEFIHPDDREMVIDRYLRRLKGEDIPNKYSFRIIDKQGNIRWVELTAVIITWEGRPASLNFLTDITDRKRLEEEQQRVDKLEAVGLLAGGIAHDFNNILTSILGNISLASMEAEPGSELQNSLEQAEKASQRAKALTVQLLTFSKGGAPVLKLASLTELLKDTAGFALSGSRVKCNFSLPANLWHAEIDAGQVSQVIHNLVINAQQSMPTGGSIEISAENIALSEMQSLGRGLPLKSGDYIRIAVADHGTGIPGDHLEKIFDPFFTTKQKGNGMGLAISFSIARQHGGHLSVESEPGRGSTFYLYLPASTQTAAPKEDKKEAMKPAGKARILVMDDEKGVREIAGRLLKHIGYKDVEFAGDGAEAIKLYKAAMESGNPFSVAILDLTIAGGMGGEIAIQKLLKIDPGVKAIVSSGYIDDPVMAKHRDHGFSGMVAKPYTIAELRKAVQDVIG